MKSGGQILINCLEAQGVDRVFCVPGESYLAALDALYDSPIQTIVARQEGGAAMMAEADGKLTGRPGVCFVTRGPGACNAASGVHVAQQDSTPMILFVGQIGRHMVGRDAFQEVDYRQMFGAMAKWVGEINHAARIPEMISRAFHVALSGRPGPVVLTLPEDMLSRERAEAKPAPRAAPASPAPAPADMTRLETLLARAKRPFMVLGGSGWDESAVAAAKNFAQKWALPVGCSFRRQGLFDHSHPNYAGDVGLAINPKLKARLEGADLLILLGGRLSENPSQGFTLLDIPQPAQKLVHIHAGAEELGRIYAPELAINAAPSAFLEAACALKALENPPWAEETQTAHADYLDWSGAPPQTPGALQMGAVIAHLREAMPEAIITNGAGNYATWIHRFWRFRRFGAQIAPTSGSMGYGLPAAIAAKLRHPGADVLCFAGDGCWQMTCQEFAAAAQYGANIITLVVDNGVYGTIRMHQERDYPKRVSGTMLQNPDFAAIARASGGYGERVAADADFPAALARARAANAPALLHLITDPEAITPTTTLSALRASRS